MPRFIKASLLVSGLCATAMLMISGCAAAGGADDAAGGARAWHKASDARKPPFTETPMNSIALVLGSITLLGIAPAQPATQPGATPKPSQPVETVKQTTFNFDKDAAGKVGGLPGGWKAEGTNQKGPAATWEVARDKTAPSAPNVLALTKTNHDSGDTFNLCWNDKVKFTDGSIEVKFKPVSGKEDQGGGLMWRVKDKDNYMIARMNPLEDNFRVYYVKDGARKQIETATVKIAQGEWHTMKIEQHGDHIRCYLDGKKYLDATDNHLQGPGGVGLWTKADAVSSFDDLKIEYGGADTPDKDAKPAPDKPDKPGK